MQRQPVKDYKAASQPYSHGAYFGTARETGRVDRPPFGASSSQVRSKVAILRPLL